MSSVRLSAELRSSERCLLTLCESFTLWKGFMHKTWTTFEHLGSVTVHKTRGREVFMLSEKAEEMQFSCFSGCEKLNPKLNLLSLYCSKNLTRCLPRARFTLFHRPENDRFDSAPMLLFSFTSLLYLFLPSGFEVLLIVIL